MSTKHKSQVYTTLIFIFVKIFIFLPCVAIHTDKHFSQLFSHFSRYSNKNSVSRQDCSCFKTHLACVRQRPYDGKPTRRWNAEAKLVSLSSQALSRHLQAVMLFYRSCSLTILLLRRQYQHMRL